MQSTVNISKARSLAEDTLSPARLTHVFGVTETIGELCRIYGLYEVSSDLTCAALLHDITKEKPLEAQLHLCKEYGIILRTEDLSCPKMLHSYTAAVFAAREFELDAEFCDAIRYHTTGRAGMSLYEKLLFLADYIEKNRTWPSCKAVRRYFYRNLKGAEGPEEKLLALDRAVLFGLNATLNELIESDQFIHRDTVDARNDLLREKNRLKKENRF